jgi:hypothetical protein
MENLNFSNLCTPIPQFITSSQTDKSMTSQMINAAKNVSVTRVNTISSRFPTFTYTLNPFEDVPKIQIPPKNVGPKNVGPKKNPSAKKANDSNPKFCDSKSRIDGSVSPHVAGSNVTKPPCNVTRSNTSTAAGVCRGSMQDESYTKKAKKVDLLDIDQYISNALPPLPPQRFINLASKESDNEIKEVGISTATPNTKWEYDQDLCLMNEF